MTKKTAHVIALVLSAGVGVWRVAVLALVVVMAVKVAQLEPFEVHVIVDQPVGIPESYVNTNHVDGITIGDPEGVITYSGEMLPISTSHVDRIVLCPQSSCFHNRAEELGVLCAEIATRAEEVGP